jgi:hypothetical protein
MIYLLPLLLLPLIGWAEPVCKKCEVIREYNKAHPGDYEYYDDYLKATDSKTQPKEDAKNPPKTQDKK